MTSDLGQHSVSRYIVYPSEELRGFRRATFCSLSTRFVCTVFPGINSDNMTTMTSSQEASTDPAQSLIYYREQVVQEVSSFYSFLTKLHIPSDASIVRYPPPGGWPSIDKESYALLKKTDTVIDLMQHLPYITRAESDGYQIYELTAVVDYEGEQVKRAIDFAKKYNMEEVDLFAIEPEADEGVTAVPPYMLVLASETSGGDGSWIMLDTNRGTITLIDGGIGRDIEGTVENDVSSCYAACPLGV